MRRIAGMEWRRSSMKTYGLAGIWIWAGLGLLVTLMALTPAMAAQMGEPMDWEELALFRRWEGIMPLFSLLTLAAFSIFSGVFAAHVVVEDYVGERAVLLLTCPVPRRDRMRVKCGLVLGVTALGGALCNLMLGLPLAAASWLYPIVEEPFGAPQLWKLLLLSLLAGVTAGGVGLMSAWVGLRRRSVPAAIVASVVLGCVLCQGVSMAHGAFPLGAAAVVLLGLLAQEAMARRVDELEW